MTRAMTRIVRYGSSGPSTALVAQRLDLVARRRQAHRALPVQDAVAVDVALRQGERELGLQAGHRQGFTQSRNSCWIVSSSTITSSLPELRSETDIFDGQHASRLNRAHSVCWRS